MLNKLSVNKRRLGGLGCAVSGAYSAVLGGSGNIIPAGCNYVGIFGQGLGVLPGSIANCAFHTNCIVAPNIPTIPVMSSWPLGTIYWMFDSLGNKALYIKL
jgi:hypothetical protein